ncbi:MAG: FUSC family protein [Cyanobacteriota bacterium]
MPLITRPDLRLALTTGLVNGLASLSALPFGYYAPMAVLAMGSGTYGGSWELGRQRILGSLLGMALLLVGLAGLRSLPLPLGLGITLGAMRWIGGSLGLRVGYKVGGMIVVMGWLVHDEQLGAWVPLRLLWTVVGIVAGLLSLSLFWPSRGRVEALACVAELVVGLAEDLEKEAGRAAASERAAAPERDAAAACAAPERAATAAETASEPAQASTAARAPSPARTQAAANARQACLERLRGLVPALGSELGDQPFRHPAFRLMETFDDACSRLLSASRTLATGPAGRDPEARRLREGEAALLQALAGRLRLWGQSLERREGFLPTPPSPAFTPPPLWLAIEEHFDHPDLNALPPRQLARLALRLSLCRQALAAVEAAERDWAALVHGPNRPPALRPSTRLGGPSAVAG